MSQINIIKGSTYKDTIRWASSECVFVSATLNVGAPATFTVVDHELVDGWQVNILHSDFINPNDSFPISVIDSTTLSIKCLDATKFMPGNVVIKYNKPVDLSGYEARMQFRDSYDSPVLLELTSQNGDIVIDDINKTIVRTIKASETEIIDWTKAIFDMEMFSGDYVIKIDSGKAKISREVTHA